MCEWSSHHCQSSTALFVLILTIQNCNIQLLCIVFISLQLNKKSNCDTFDPLLYECCFSLSSSVASFPSVVPLDKTCLCMCSEMLQCTKECLTRRDASQGGPHPSTTPLWTRWTTMGEPSICTKTHRGTQCCVQM